MMCRGQCYRLINELGNRCSSLPDTFGESERRAKEIVPESRNHMNCSQGGRSQCKHRIHYGLSGTSKSRSFLESYTVIKAKDWRCLYGERSKPKVLCWPKSPKNCCRKVRPKRPVLN